MKKVLSIAALVVAAALAVTLLPRPTPAQVPHVDSAAFDAQIDARLHALLDRVAREAKATARPADAIAAR
jgi:hypothetical protein